MPPLFHVAICRDAWVHHRRCWLPSRCLVIVIASSVVGILKAASRAFLLVPFYILPLVDCSVSPLGTLSGVHLPTNHVVNAVAAGVEDQCNLRWPGVGATATDLFQAAAIITIITIVAIDTVVN